MPSNSNSKWFIWDYFNSAPKDFLGSFHGVLGLSTFDPICLKLVKDHLVKGAGDKIIHHKLASEVTKNWIEEEFQTLSFFGGSECFFIHQANELKIDMLELFYKLDLAERFVILSFETENANWKKLAKQDAVSTLTIEAPRFYEGARILDFACNMLRVPLAYDAKGWLLESLENDLGTFYNACNLLKLNHPDDREITLTQVKALFVTEKLDHFFLASLYARKKFGEFFDRLLGREWDFDKMRGFFMFMQGHLVKMADTSFLAKKDRLNQYDKDLQSASKLWKQAELLREVERMNDWELKCKKKHVLLWSELREAQLKVLGIR